MVVEQRSNQVRHLSPHHQSTALQVDNNFMGSFSLPGVTYDIPKYLIDVSTTVLKAISFDLTGVKHSADEQSLQKLIQNVFYVSRVSHSVLLASLLYLLRFRFLAIQRIDALRKSHLLEVKNWVFVTFVASITLASKFHEDGTTHNQKWSENSGIKVQTINQVEATLLFIINYRLEIKKTTFNDWVKFVFSANNLRSYRRGNWLQNTSEESTGDESDQLADLLIEFSRGKEKRTNRQHLKI